MKEDPVTPKASLGSLSDHGVFKGVRGVRRVFGGVVVVDLARVTCWTCDLVCECEENLPISVE